MANINSTSLSGNIVRDIELKKTTNGIPVTNATLAVTDYKENTSFIDLVFFGKVAEIAAKYLKKGSPAAITGHIQQRSYETKDGSKRSVIEVIVDNLQLLGSGNKTASNAVERATDNISDDFDDMPADLSAIPF